MKKTKFMALIEGLEAPADQKSECARIFGRTNRKIADLVEDLVLRSMKGQLQAPDFKLNPGCSIVCPLIAFLEGSGGDKPEMTHQAGIC